MGIRRDSEQRYRETAELLNGLPEADRERILAEMARQDPALAVEIQKRLFGFEKFLKVDAILFGNWVSRIRLTDLALALRGAPDELKNHFLTKLTQRSAQAVREEMLAMGPQPQSQVEEARRRLIQDWKAFEAQSE